MRRSPLNRKTSNFKMREPMRRVSDMQKVELARRRKLKAELLLENPLRVCRHCGQAPDFRGLQLVHKIPLSLGGKTDRDNCELWCAPCHFGIDGHRTETK